jgi:hypothetical protein
MNNMQTFYRWLFTDSTKQEKYRTGLVGLSQADLTTITSAASFWGWNFWGSASGPEKK